MCQIVRPQKVLLFGCVFPKLKKKKLFDETYLSINYIIYHFFNFSHFVLSISHEKKEYSFLSMLYIGLTPSNGSITSPLSSSYFFLPTFVFLRWEWWFLCMSLKNKKYIINFGVFEGVLIILKIGWYFNHLWGFEGLF